jgi:hypothetical protein
MIFLHKSGLERSTDYYMGNRILAVGYDRPHFKAVRKDWQKYNVHLDTVETAREAIEQFSYRQYLAVIASYNVPNITRSLTS